MSLVYLNQSRESQIVALAGNYAANDWREQRQYSRFRKHHKYELSSNVPLQTNFSPLQQMRLLPMGTDDDVTVLQELMNVIGPGIVTPTDPENITFPLHTRAKLCLDRLPVSSSRLDLNLKWSEPTKHLPKPPTVVYFTGVLQRFDVLTQRRHGRVPSLFDVITYIKKPRLHPLQKKRKRTRKTERRVRQIENARSTSQPTLLPPLHERRWESERPKDPRTNPEKSIRLFPLLMTILI